jgi:hypothetical protein
MTNRFPSALRRSDSLGPSVGKGRKGPTPAEVAMMDSATYRQFAQSRGQWESADRELIGNMQNPEAKTKGS